MVAMFGLIMPAPLLIPVRVIGWPLISMVREAAFVLRNGSLADIFRFPFYECARHLGFWLGMHAEMLPVRWRKACGDLGYFWDRGIER